MLVTWPQKHTDYALESKDGSVFQCHKHVLAYSSPYLEAMLKEDDMSRKKGSLKVSFSAGISANFLEYLYSNKTNEGLAGLAKKTGGLDGPNSRRIFNHDKLTPDLLIMAHQYQVRDLQEDCIRHLSENINGENAVDVWMAARTCESNELKEAALHVLVGLMWVYKSRALGKSVGMDVIPKLGDVFNSPQLASELMKYTLENVTYSPGKQDDTHFYVYVFGPRLPTTKVFLKSSNTVEDLKVRVSHLYLGVVGEKLSCEDFVVEPSSLSEASPRHFTVDMPLRVIGIEKGTAIKIVKNGNVSSE